ncbi:MAG: DUF4116 domain-containing protein [Bacilli bacterium]|nr:DUF4116 domain-containing protein [Bacilli bacterium]
MDNLRGEEFLDKLYNGLHMSDEVMHTASNKDSKKEKIHRYMDRLERVNKKASKRENDINTLKHLYHKKYVIDKEELPDYLSDYEKEYNIKIQEESLDKWLDYLLDTNTPYPTWAKYWAFQGMLKIGTYDEENDVYQKRSKKTVAPFIEADPEIIAKCIEVVSRHVNKEKIDDKSLEKLVASGNFSKLYTLFIKNKRKKVFRTDNIDDGIWIKYHHETIEEAEEKEKKGITPEYIKLYNSLQGYNTYWCTAGSKNMAKYQICNEEIKGDFYVYYTKDENGEYKVPRVAIRMGRFNLIAEIRGVADESQNIEDGFEEIISQKIKTFNYKKDYLEYIMQVVYDMKELTYLNKKNKHKETYTYKDILFIYELYGKDIKSFGWKKDERINKILSSRNIKEDYNLLTSIQDKIEFLCVISKSRKLDERTIGEKDRNIILSAVRKEGLALKHADESLKKDREIVLEAVKKNSYALEYADASLKKDKKIVLTALKKFSSALQYADDSLKKDKEVALFAINVSGYALEYVDESLKKDKNLVLFAINKVPLSLKYADDSLKKDKEVVLSAVKQEGYAIMYADDSLKKDKEVVLEAVKQNGWALQYADASLKKDKEIVLAAIKQDSYSIKYADESLKEDPEFMKEVKKIIEQQEEEREKSAHR